MGTQARLNNFRFSIYIDTDGTVTLTDLPPELREVAATLDPSYQWGPVCPIPTPDGSETAGNQPSSPMGTSGEEAIQNT